MRKLAIAVLLLSGCAFAQNARFDAEAINASGRPIPNVIVTVCTATATGIPCSPAVSTFTDVTGGTACGAGTQVTLPGSSTCQATGSSTGNYGFWVTPGTNYRYSLSGPGITGVLYDLTEGLAPGGSGSFTNVVISGTLGVTGNATVTGNLIVGGKSPWVDPTAPPYNCKFDDVTDDTACLQAAITATPHGGELRLPAGKSALITCASPVNNACLNVPYPMKFGGTGMNTDQFGSVLKIPITVPITVDAMRLLGDANGSDGYYLHDFAFQCDGGAGVCARSVVNIDVTSFPIARLTIARVAMGYGQWGSCGLRITNPTPLLNGFFVSDIGPGNIIKNGVCGQNIGDSVRFWNNDVPYSTGSPTCTPGFDLSYVTGAQQTTISGNNVTQTKCGALHLGSAARSTYVFDNFFEGGVSGTDTGSNGALVDLDCTTTQHCQHVDLHDNIIQPVTTNIDGIRYNFADSTNVHDNTITRGGGTGVDHRVTANATATHIGWNRYEPTGDVLVNILADAGTTTQYEFYGFQSVNGFTLGNRLYVPDGVQSAPAYAFTAEGNTGFYRASAAILGVSVTNTDVAIYQTNKTQLGNAFGYCWASTAGASAGGNDTCLSRSAAGVVSADTTAIGNGLGTFKANGIAGTTTNNNATAGNVGELITSVIATGSSVSLATGVTSNVTSVSLTAGDWDCSGAVDFTFGATTSYTNLIGSISTTTGTIGGQDSKFDFETSAIVPTGTNDATFALPIVRELLSATTTVFLVAQGTFTLSTLKAYGTIRCRRVR
jgi:hypothetical protein